MNARLVLRLGGWIALLPMTGWGAALGATVPPVVPPPLTVISEAHLWSGISVPCQMEVGVSEAQLRALARAVGEFSLEELAKDPFVPSWSRSVDTAKANSVCSSDESARFHEALRRFRETSARRVLKRLMPQLEAVSEVRPPVRELALLRKIRKLAGIADGHFYPKGFKKKIRARGRAAAAARKAACTTITPQAIAPDQELDRARRQSRGWCFAFATADLFSAKLGTKVSGSALAASYFRDRPVFAHARNLGEIFRNIGEGLGEASQWSVLDKEGGYLTRVLATALDQGFVCSEKSVPSEVQAERGSYHLPGELEARYDEALVDLEAIHEELTTELFEHPRYGPSSDSQGMPMISSELLHDRAEVRRLRDTYFCEGSRLREAMTTLFPRATFEDFLQVAVEVPRSEAFEELARRGCQALPVPKNRFKIGFHEENGDGTGAGLKLIRSIDRQLEKSNPVLIAYSSAGLAEPENSRRVFLRTRPQASKEAPVFDHASLIAGRTWSESEQACLYQIKNSWGEECSHYSSAVLCQRGAVWVKEDHLRDMISEVAWLEEKGTPPVGR